jgi:hypothetical protein
MTPATKVNAVKEPPKAREVQKEDWEIAAEQGLATEGGRRRARVAAAHAQNSKENSLRDMSTPSSHGLCNPQYYTAVTHTLIYRHLLRRK